MKKLDTTLFLSGAEFLVLSKLLSARIESYKAYEKQEGYDLLSVNVTKKLSETKIQVISYEKSIEKHPITSMTCSLYFI